MIDTTAVVAAGGYGTRCDSGVPKSLLRVGKRTYLEALLIQLTLAGVEDAIVYCNRLEYVPQILMLSQHIMPTRVCVDRGVDSTLILAKHSASIVSSYNILFCYGHAPRPAKYLKSLLVHPESPVVSVVDTTSKKAAIAYQGGGYVEPPYKLSVSSLRRSCSMEWVTYFAQEGECPIGISVDGPGEFNYLGECYGYGQYLDSWTVCEEV